MQPVIIIGAPRSGTNMLRDVLTSIDNVCTWPCDEINYIWRHGNVNFHGDDIPVGLCTESTRKYIRGKFVSLSKKYKSHYVVEKTCANSLRIPFVDHILPDAKYIYICRDSFDVTASAEKRWKSSIDIRYIFRKLRYVPLLDIPFYGLRYIWSHIYRYFSNEERVAFWGPSFSGFDKIIKTHTLNETCALQWKGCVDASEDAFKSISKTRFLRVYYESFVLNPEVELSRILDFLEISVPTAELRRVTGPISAASIGIGRRQLGLEEVKKLDKLVGDTMRNLGYD